MSPSRTLRAAVFALAASATLASAQLAPRVPDSAIGVPYTSGGFGLDERERLEAESHQYNLRLIFAMREDTPYLADVEVVIHDAAGKKILAAVDTGPWFFAKLPAGSYRVSATSFGKTLTQRVQVPESGQARAGFYWEKSDAFAKGTRE